MTTLAERVEEECWAFADAYRDASARRAEAEGRQAIGPKDPKLGRDRFDAGMAEEDAWDNLLRRTRDLMELAGLPRAAEIRQAAIRQATAAGLNALRKTLREAKPDAA